MLYCFHISTDRLAPFPPRYNMGAIEARNALAATRKLQKLPILGYTGQPHGWLRVVDSWNEDGTPLRILSRRVKLPVAAEGVAAECHLTGDIVSK